jgi:hypothetical protein
MPLSCDRLRVSLAGLIALAAIEDELLLASARASDVPAEGSPQSWAALPLVAHNTEFKRQQVIRLRALRAGTTPRSFADVDHRSPEAYQRYARRTAAQVVNEQRRVTSALVDEIAQISDDDLTDPARNPWLRGRQLWLQIVVRGFWHPLGHVGEYYLEHAQPERALTLHEHAVATTSYLDAPDPARGMAQYSLACVQARAGLLVDAESTLRGAVELNTDLREKAASDPDLAGLRDSALLGSPVPA